MQLCPAATTLKQDLHTLDLPREHFDGIFANAVLFHVKRSELPRVLGEIKAAVAKGGVIFVSNPRSMGSADVEKGGNPLTRDASVSAETDDDARYGHYQTLASWRAVCQGVGLVELEHYYRPPGRPQHEQPWLASVWRCP